MSTYSVIVLNLKASINHYVSNINLSAAQLLRKKKTPLYISCFFVVINSQFSWKIFSFKPQVISFIIHFFLSTFLNDTFYGFSMLRLEIE